MTFESFKQTVYSLNSGLLSRGLRNDTPDFYTTINRDVVRFVIWDGTNPNDPKYGAQVLSVQYGGREPMDNAGDAGNVTDPFLNGTVLTSGPSEGVVKITNYFLNTQIVLDMTDQWHPKRTSETGAVEVAGYKSEVWVDFDWTGPAEGDFFRPFKTLAAAVNAVDDGGVIRIMDGSTSELLSPPGNKRYSIVAAGGDVRIGAR